ncbi:MAG: heme ABC exporter ATP-binding protein CcmA [Actinobacteria bacterium]|nr:MAG: heme ABC exporter ATP-binding protein CcmA [Actinomycetota bacterium]
MSRVVDFQEAVVVFNGFPALAGATFNVERGEIVLLQGPNGAGKTTLLRACAGLLPVVRGSASVLGIDLGVDRQSVRARVGLLGHANGLFADLTIRQNVLFWAEMIGATPTEVDASLVSMGIDGSLSNQKVGQLSAGQKRRCALACLVVRRAELWLLDEPHAGLDASGRDEIDAIIRAAVAAGATVIVASHELERARSLATRRVIVESGQVR